MGFTYMVGKRKSGSDEMEVNSRLETAKPKIDKFEIGRVEVSVELFFFSFFFGGGLLVTETRDSQKRFSEMEMENEEWGLPLS